MFKSKKDTVYIILAGIFITNAVVAELIGGKLIFVGTSVMSIGILPWPIVFVTTDLINDYFGEKGVKKLSLITASLISYCFLLLYFAIKIPAAKGISTINDEQFFAVFGQSMWIIVHYVKKRTGNKMIWLRSTGSTVISQLFDSFIVLGIAFWMTGIMTTEVYIQSAFTGYFVKLIIAVCMTPLLYLGHYLIEKYLAKK